MSKAQPSGRTAEGWLIKYNTLSHPFTLPSGRQVYEMILPDAFRDSVDAINRGEAAIECNIEHTEDDALMRLGTTDVNVKIENRAEGVYGTVDFINDTISNDLFTRIKTGLVTGLSVECCNAPGIEPAYELANGNYIRKLSKLVLKGFAVTAAPMYPDAKIVRVMEAGQPVFARSAAAAELDAIAREIERIEGASKLQFYTYQAFLLGIRP